MKSDDAEILLVESDESVAELIIEHLGEASAWHDGLDDGPGVNIRHLTTAEQALAEYCVKPADLVLTDLELPDGSGFAMVVPKQSISCWVHPSRICPTSEPGWPGSGPTTPFAFDLPFWDGGSALRESMDLSLTVGLGVMHSISR